MSLEVIMLADVHGRKIFVWEANDKSCLSVCGA